MKRIILERDKILGKKKIGYLHGDFPRGKVPKGFISKLKEVENSQKIKIVTPGHHLCEYCYPWKGDEQYFKNPNPKAMSSGDNIAGDYIWPDMLIHYIEDHQYLPPQEFIDFIMSFQMEK